MQKTFLIFLEMQTEVFRVKYISISCFKILKVISRQSKYSRVLIIIKSR